MFSHPPHRAHRVGRLRSGRHRLLSALFRHVRPFDRAADRAGARGCASTGSTSTTASAATRRSKRRRASSCPTRYGDDVEIETTITKIGRSSFSLQHRLTLAGALAVEGNETRCWVVRDASRPGGLRAASDPRRWWRASAAVERDPPTGTVANWDRPRAFAATPIGHGRCKARHCAKLNLRQEHPSGRNIVKKLIFGATLVVSAGLASSASAQLVGIGTSPQGTLTYQIGASVAKVMQDVGKIPSRIQPQSGTSTRHPAAEFGRDRHLLRQHRRKSMTRSTASAPSPSSPIRSCA